MEVNNGLSTANEPPTILIAADSLKDASKAKKYLTADYKKIHTSTNQNIMISDFEMHVPDILILAFDSLEKSKNYYLGLYRLCSIVHMHRTIILCNQNEANHVSDLCLKSYFDDYVLFWPAVRDKFRLSIAVHHAMRDLIAYRDNFSAIEFSINSRRTAAFESILISDTKTKEKELKLGSLQLPKILVVDDDELHCKLIGTMLTKEGYKVFHSNSGVEALNILETLQPDLILLDMEMPEMNGIETAGCIKSNKNLFHIPIIVVTANSSEEVVTSCIEEGASDFIVKPISRRVLLSKMNRQLSQQV